IRGSAHERSEVTHATVGSGRWDDLGPVPSVTLAKMVIRVVRERPGARLRSLDDGRDVVGEAAKGSGTTLAHFEVVVVAAAGLLDDRSLLGCRRGSMRQRDTRYYEHLGGGESQCDALHPDPREAGAVHRADRRTTVSVIARCQRCVVPRWGLNPIVGTCRPA